jgi:ABC-type Mn2+/Zn2+ transport system permease subunit
MRFIEYIESPFIVRALLASILIALNAGFAGSFAMFRNSTFLVSGASHAALAGAAAIILLHSAGIWAGVDPMIGGGVTAILLAVLAAYASYHGKPGEIDTQIGVGFALSMAVALVLVSLIPESASRVWTIMIGDILLVSWPDLLLLTIETAVVIFLFIALRREFLFITFDVEGAKAFGINAGRYNLLMFALIGLSVAAMMKGIGAILVFAMMVAPAATAMLLARSIEKVIIGAMLIAISASLLGILVSFFLHLSVSAVAAFLSAGAYFAVAGVQKYSRMKARRG